MISRQQILGFNEEFEMLMRHYLSTVVVRRHCRSDLKSNYYYWLIALIKIK